MRRVPAPERKGWDGRARWDHVDEEEDVGKFEKEEGAEQASTTATTTTTTKKKDKTGGEKKRRMHVRVPRPPLPLSARRDAGHVVFRGSDRVDVSMDEVREVGDGVFAV